MAAPSSVASLPTVGSHDGSPATTHLLLDRESQKVLFGLYKKLQTQEDEVRRAFQSTLQTVQWAAAQCNSANTNTVTTENSNLADNGSVVAAALCRTVQAVETLFRFLFECVYLHQVDCDFAFAEDVESILLRMTAPATSLAPSGASIKKENNTVDVAAVDVTRDMLHASVEKLRRAPVSVQRFQSKHFPEVPLMSAPRSVTAPPAAPSGAGPQQGEATTHQSSSSHASPEAAPASSATTAMTASEELALTRASTHIFAVSSAYSAAERQEIIDVITSVHRTAIVLPAVRHEESLALRLRCCCVVTPLAPAERAAAAKLLIPHVRREVLMAYVRDRKPSTSAVMVAPLSSASLTGVSSSTTCNDGEVDEELTRLLEMLDTAMVQDSPPPPVVPTNQAPAPDAMAMPPPSPSASQWAQPFSLAEQQQHDGLKGLTQDGIYDRNDLRVFARRGTAGLLKRARPLAQFRASASQAEYKCEDGVVRGAARRHEWATAPTAVSSPSQEVMEVEDGDEEEEPLKTLSESQLIHYQHSHSDDDDETEAWVVAEEPLKQLPRDKWLFQVSHSCKDKRRDILRAITTLGSQVDTGNQFNNNCTHLIVAEGLTERTEKYLSACAAGRMIVSPRYVFDSLARGHWIEGRAKEYCMNPQLWLHRHHRSAPFAAWRVLLVTCHLSVATGIRTVLRAGGCGQIKSFVFDSPEKLSSNPSNTLPVELGQPLPSATGDGDDDEDADWGTDSVVGSLDSSSSLPEACVARCTHMLVECVSMSPTSTTGCFELPPWFPSSLRREGLHRKLFTLELLYHCMCGSTEVVFDAQGQLIGEELISPACRVDPF